MTKIAQALRVPVGTSYFSWAQKAATWTALTRRCKGGFARTALELLNEPASNQRALI